MQYWLKTYNNLPTQKQSFSSMEELLAFLGPFIREAEENKRLKEIEKVNMDFQKGNMDKETRHAKIEKIKKWKGFSLRELVDPDTKERVTGESGSIVVCKYDPNTAASYLLHNTEQEYIKKLEELERDSKKASLS